MKRNERPFNLPLIPFQTRSKVRLFPIIYDSWSHEQYTFHIVAFCLLVYIVFIPEKTLLIIRYVIVLLTIIRYVIVCINMHCTTGTHLGTREAKGILYVSWSLRLLNLTASWCDNMRSNGAETILYQSEQP